ncbi:hypothetical protein MRB53_009264 [Persea americana]|uniref:Uncharacterized protein n=1 Tax=Persea americana TaxID=3435 RepID=A0ACC2LPJ0_PERAE|nr:hypothetical protein MRB53_009264 [Persea americana]
MASWCVSASLSNVCAATASLRSHGEQRTRSSRSRSTGTGALTSRPVLQRRLGVICMAPDEEKMTRRSPLDFPIVDALMHRRAHVAYMPIPMRIRTTHALHLLREEGKEWERPKPGRRPDIFPQFSPMKTPLPPPMPADPPEEDEEEEEKKEEEEEDPDQEENPDNPEKQ